MRRTRLRERVQGWAGDWANAAKLDLIGLASMPFAAGSAFASGASPLGVVTVGAAGACLHVGTALINNIADRSSDAIHPRRRTSPIVQGRISVGHAAAVSAVAIALTAVLLLIAVSGTQFVMFFVPLIVVQSYGNAFQKRSRRVSPMIMDVLFGLTMGYSLAVFSLLDPPASMTPPILLGVALAVDMVALNVAVGNTKDLPWDRAAGDCTTALLLGVRPAEDGSADLILPSAFRWYVTSLLLFRTVPLAIALGVADGGRVASSLVVAASVLAPCLWIAGTRTRRLAVSGTPARAFVPIGLLSLFLSFVVIEPSREMGLAVAGVVLASVLGTATNRPERVTAPSAATD